MPRSKKRYRPAPATPESNTLSRMSRALTAVLMGFFHGSIIISLMIMLTIFLCHIRKVLMGVMPQIINCEQTGILQQLPSKLKRVTQPLTDVLTGDQSRLRHVPASVVVQIKKRGLFLF